MRVLRIKALPLACFLFAVGLLALTACGEEEDLLSGKYRIVDATATADERKMVIVLEKASLGWDGHAELDGESMPHFLLRLMDKDKAPAGALQCGGGGVTIFCAMQKGAAVNRSDGGRFVSSTGYFFGVSHAKIWEVEKVK